jgi:hypothetical protein
LTYQQLLVDNLGGGGLFRKVAGEDADLGEQLHDLGANVTDFVGKTSLTLNL